MEQQIKDRFSLLLSDLRKQQKLTQEQMSERLDTSPRCFQKWDNGHSLPDFLHTLALVYFLGFDLHSLAKEVFSNDTVSTAEG